jgi:hypothetical protein
MRKILLFLPLLFILSCIPKRENVKLSSTYLETNIPKPFEGELSIETLSVPFYYEPKGDYIEFPLTYAGFVSYENRTLCLTDYCKTLPVELWKILKHRLLKPDYEVYREGNGYVAISHNPTVYLYLDNQLKPIKARICTAQGCETYIYKGNKVITTFYGKTLTFTVGEEENN